MGRFVHVPFPRVACVVSSLRGGNGFSCYSAHLTLGRLLMSRIRFGLQLFDLVALVSGLLGCSVAVNVVRQKGFIPFS